MLAVGEITIPWCQRTARRFELVLYLLVCRRCREGKHQIFLIPPIRQVAFIHGGRRWQRWEARRAIRACRCGWTPTGWTLRGGRVAHAAPCPWVGSLENCLTTTPSWGEHWSRYIPTRHRIDTRVGKRVRRSVWMLAGGLGRFLSQIGDSHSVRLRIAGKRGRLRASSSACHPCFCRDRTRILTADLCSHHVGKVRRGGKVQKGTCPSPLSSE